MAQASRGVLIDTSILIAHFRGRLSLEELANDLDSLFISAVTVYELEYGASKAGRASDFARIERAFRPMILEFGQSEAEQAARINGSLARTNQQIGPYDALIAGTALQHGLELMTLNVNEFRRVPGLAVVSPQ
ncbi:MAG: type II toxin-antitoxin system VapC family toxin [Chloroflexi bacterium]|nr:type II toxin-antitoxin system VapC family toxin [Chloroflexota bacterium]